MTNFRFTTAGESHGPALTTIVEGTPAGLAIRAEEIDQECCGLIREKVGPVASFKLAMVVARLRKTRSGKILRGTIKKIADGQPWTMPATIDDPAILDEIGAVLKGRGVGGR